MTVCIRILHDFDLYFSDRNIDEESHLIQTLQASLSKLENEKQILEGKLVENQLASNAVSVAPGYGSHADDKIFDLVKNDVRTSLSHMQEMMEEIEFMQKKLDNKRLEIDQLQENFKIKEKEFSEKILRLENIISEHVEENERLRNINEKPVEDENSDTESQKEDLYTFVPIKDSFVPIAIKEKTESSEKLINRIRGKFYCEREKVIDLTKTLLEKEKEIAAKVRPEFSKNLGVSKNFLGFRTGHTFPIRSQCFA